MFQDEIFQDRILQGGHIRCPICGNSFNWSYRLQIYTGSRTEYVDKTITSVNSTPHRYISHITTADGRVRFMVGCESCGYSIETETMELMNEANYKKYKP